MLVGTWALWTVTFLMAASINRGGMLAMLAALAVPLVLRTSRLWMPLVLTTVLISSIAFVDLEFSLGGRRAISPRQLVLNALSIVDRDASDDLSGTREWRLRWWQKIVDYTLFGDHGWTGKGFGINLHRDDGVATSRASILRSPHNGHLTVLARSGLPGACLWLALQSCFAVTMVRALRYARRHGRTGLAALHAWVLAYWAAFVVNASFDVFLEGPQGGIWFWCLMGFGMALMDAQRRGASDPTWTVSR
jgi:O-antigen ligase